MPSHCRSGMLGMGPVNRHPFSLNFKSSSIPNTSFDVHRPYQLQVDSCTSAFQAVKDYSSSLLASQLQHHQEQHQHQHQVSSSNSTGGAVLSVNPAHVEEVDVETILQLGELQDWAWPSTNSSLVEPQEIKPSELQSLPYQAHQPLHLSSTIVHSSDIIHHSDQKDSTSSKAAAELFGAFPPPLLPQSHPGEAPEDKSFDLQSWCSAVRTAQCPQTITIPKFFQALGFSTSAAPSPTTMASPLRLQNVRERCSTAEVPQHVQRNSNHHVAAAPAYNQVEALGVQKKWHGKRQLSQRENHIWSERQRRKGMNHLFSTLRSLLPLPTSKTDKSTVVSEIIKYIKGLQAHREELQKKRMEILHRKSMDVIMVGAVVKRNSPTTIGNSISSSSGTLTGVPLGTESCLLQSFVLPNVALHISGNNGFITMSSPKRRGLLARILSIMQSYRLHVVSAYMSTSDDTVFHCLHVMTPPGHDKGFPKETLQLSLQNLSLPE
ncbi:hypothetical protein R1flu_027012 [Riccia fluitans]|uniref:BHLH domain-containing protein n=1 Tax=Riccia fluitans TaxID=41844 RepID=A0ABD1XHJ8_9MARC